MTAPFFDHPATHKWLWIELIGFDNTLPDFGVAEFLARCGFQPDGVALLFSSAGFVMRHAGMDKETKLAPVDASYAAHSHSIERARQVWTNHLLRDLIAVLHQHGCLVYLSYLNLYQYNDDAGGVISEPWFTQRPELNETRRDGSSQASINVLKHVDGQPFADILQRRTLQVLQDYNLDGLQIADGISSPRLALQEGDYSDDSVGSFLAETGIALPPQLALTADGDPDAMLARAEWIWQSQRSAWIAHHTRRWQRYYRTFVGALHAAGKQVIFNSAWTREPFEAIYRYGVDYRAVAATGIDGCMVEDVSPGLAILSERDNGYLMNDAQRRRLYYEFLVTLMFNRAAMPALRITPLASIHDTMEQWGVLQHAPTSMVRNVMSNLNTLVFHRGSYRPATDGPYFCLADGLSASDWAFICKIWVTAYSPEPLKPAGAAVIWSDARVDHELTAFIATRRTPSHRLVSELLYGGAPLYAAARIDDLEGIRGALLVTNPDLLPPDEQALLRTYQGGAVLALACGELPQAGSCLVREVNSFGGAALWHYNAAAQDTAAETVVVTNPAVYEADPCRYMEAVGMLWTRPLDFAPLSEAFFRACAHVITRLTGAPSLVHDGEARNPCNLISVWHTPDHYRVFIGNDNYYYNHPLVEMGRPIECVSCLTKFAGYEVPIEGSTFSGRIPGRGMEAFEVWLAPSR